MVGCPECGTVMWVNSDNLHCGRCGKRIYFNTNCPNGCGKMYVNVDDLHCNNCGHREFFDKILKKQRRNSNA